MGGNVTITMTNSTGETVVRTIDSTNAKTSGSECWELRGEGEQRSRLESWIRERGNAQHKTILTLVSWTFSFKKGVFS